MSLPIPGLRPIAAFWAAVLVAGSAGAIALQSLGAPHAPVSPVPVPLAPAAMAAAPQSGLVNEAADPLAGMPVAAAPAPVVSAAPAALPLPPVPATPPPMLADANAAKLPPLRPAHAALAARHPRPAPRLSLARRETHHPVHIARRTTTTTTIVAEVPSYSTGSVQYRSYPDGWRPYYAEAYPPPPPYYVAPYRGYYAAY